jgi:dTDP-4-dehydrorhamnose 3,5-epimerase
MQVERFAIEGPLVLTPRAFGDGRGFFFESWNERSFAEALGVAPEAAPLFRQDNQSRSCRGVLRGLHYQLEPEPQGKLVRCVAGEIFDVAVDIRRGSPTFGQWVGARLSGTNHQQLWVPVGFAHGFLTLSDSADVLYKASGFWNRECERSIRWDDADFAIEWPLAELGDQEVLLAEKDAAAPSFAEAQAKGDVFR